MVKAIVGANWGDEGKGKITDMLAEESDIIVRFQVDVLKSDKEQNPERLFIDQENAESLEDKLYSVLSGFEKNVLELYMSGKDYIAIAQMLDKPPKSIDNAIQRIRNKVDKITNL